MDNNKAPKKDKHTGCLDAISTLIAGFVVIGITCIIISGVIAFFWKCLMWWLS